VEVEEFWKLFQNTSTSGEEMATNPMLDFSVGPEEEVGALNTGAETVSMTNPMAVTRQASAKVSQDAVL
jgi:hypothetical protein